MNALKLKICGMRQPENIQEVAEHRPDFMGFIFYGRSPRYVGKSFEVPDSLDPMIKRVGVFVNERLEEVERNSREHSLDYVQLHGAETPDYCKQLRSRGIKVIKVFSVHDAFDFNGTTSYAPYADYFLFDTKGKYHGGNAKPFNWDKLKEYDQSLPFFLSGGLSSANIKGIANLKNMNLYALDVNSRVEKSPGIKDTELVKDLLTEIKHLNDELSR